MECGIQCWSSCCSQYSCSQFCGLWHFVECCSPYRIQRCAAFNTAFRCISSKMSFRSLESVIQKPHVKLLVGFGPHMHTLLIGVDTGAVVWISVNAPLYILQFKTWCNDYASWKPQSFPRLPLFAWAPAQH